ncbi:hypothetical protein LTR37_005237 [Vermiconidia calcicola]|uniref:Uncharacterized protein n=1 Tax=Vermiconidia calcicola TaxID=1690605 RepID=A0ACC3NJL0_9PEZI|nr:hypothetical protein LTR37_005237 [Vermiconidia calcicola]
MSTLTYSNPTGYAAELGNQFSYSQAVRLPGNILKISGQGGWDPSSGNIPAPTSAEAISDQVARAFANVDDVLRAAGSSRGMEDFDGAAVTATKEGLQKWCPDHRPVLTAVEVKGLALKGMRIEIEVEAYEG